MGRLSVTNCPPRCVSLQCDSGRRPACYQESYQELRPNLAPILDASKFTNQTRLRRDQFSHHLRWNAALRSPTPSRDCKPRPATMTTTVRAICPRDTLVVSATRARLGQPHPDAGLDVQPFTANSLTPESLAGVDGLTRRAGPPTRLRRRPPTHNPDGNLPGAAEFVRPEQTRCPAVVSRSRPPPGTAPG